MNIKRQQKLTIVLYIIYLFLLTWLVLFKFQTNFNNLSRFRNINLIPFRGSMIVNGKIYLREIIYNILVFVPMGIFISIRKPDWLLIKKVMVCFCISLLFEVLQYVFAIGASDITDLIGNTLGSIMGIGLFAILKKAAGDNAVKIVNILAIIVSTAAILLLLLLFIANR